MCCCFCVIENLPFQVHTLSHPEEALSWFCRSKGCLGDCTKAVYMDQMCETETQKAGNHMLMSFRWCTVQKTVNVWAWQAYFKCRLTSEIWCKYSFPIKMHGKLWGFLNDGNRRGQCSYRDIITPKRKQHLNSSTFYAERDQNTHIWNTSPPTALFPQNSPLKMISMQNWFEHRP